MAPANFGCGGLGTSDATSKYGHHGLRYNGERRASVVCVRGMEEVKWVYEMWPALVSTTELMEILYSAAWLSPRVGGRMEREGERDCRNRAERRPPPPRDNPLAAGGGRCRAEEPARLSRPRGRQPLRRACCGARRGIRCLSYRN